MASGGFGVADRSLAGQQLVD